MAELIAVALVALLAGVGIGVMSWRRPLFVLRERFEALVQEHGQARVELGVAQERAAAAEAMRAQLETLRAERDAAASELAALRSGSEERRQALEERVATLRTDFETLSQAALQQSQAHFRELAQAALADHRANADAGLKELLAPVSDTLKRYEEGLKAVEQAREQAYGSLREQLTAVAAGQARVSEEAGRLVTALRSSGKTSGSWGEQQLRNVLELAGLREGVDFTLQASVTTESGARRPDAVIRLPGGRELIVDSKCSLNDYLAAAGADETGRREAIARHAAAVRAHARGLAEKAYWKEFGAAADFVVMFLPGENYLSAALEQDLTLLDWAFQNKILLAGPINLLAIAKTVALVWRQETLASEAREIGKLGADLYASVAVMAEHVEGVGGCLDKAVKGYNKLVGSLEQNVLPKARRFSELGVETGKRGVPELGPVETQVREPRAPELSLPRPAQAAE